MRPPTPCKRLGLKTLSILHVKLPIEALPLKPLSNRDPGLTGSEFNLQALPLIEAPGFY